MSDTVERPRAGGEAVELDRVIIRFAGDSGDGMQLTGDRFTNVSTLVGNDVVTLPEFPAEIRAPAGTVAGVSAFQIHISDHEITTPGDAPQVLIAMNPAALRSELRAARAGRVRSSSTPTPSTSAASPRRATASNPLTDGTLAGYRVYEIPMTSLTKDAALPFGVKPRDADRSKNFFALGLVSWMYTRPVEPTLEWIERRFGPKPLVRDANIAAFKAGYAFGETAELFDHQLRGAARTPGAGHLHERHRQHRAGVGPRRRRRGRRSCRCSSARTRSPRRRTSSTSCPSTRTSGCGRCRPRTRSPASAPPSAPPSAATSASRRRAARASPSRARRWASPSASSCRCS